MAETGAIGPDGAPPAGGLLALIQDYMRTIRTAQPVADFAARNILRTHRNEFS
jgi:hypothetical protein